MSLEALKQILLDIGYLPFKEIPTYEINSPIEWSLHNEISKQYEERQQVHSTGDDVEASRL